MSENKFTPGPWKALLVANYWIDSEKCSICSIDSSSINAEANANLIAAAPELLEVAEALLGWIDSVPEDTVLPTMPGVDRDWIDSVIAKAKGKYDERE